MRRLISWPKACRDKAKQEGRTLIALGIEHPGGGGISVVTSVSAKDSKRLADRLHRLHMDIMKANGKQADA